MPLGGIGGRGEKKGEPWLDPGRSSTLLEWLGQGSEVGDTGPTGEKAALDLKRLSAVPSQRPGQTRIAQTLRACRVWRRGVEGGWEEAPVRAAHACNV